MPGLVPGQLLSLQMAGDRDFVPLLVTWWSGTRKRVALDMELCTNSKQLSRSQVEPYLPPVMSRVCYFFVDQAETLNSLTEIVNFGSNSYPGATRSQAGRREPLQGCHCHAHLRLGTPRSTIPNTGELYQHPTSLGFVPFSAAAQPPFTKMGIRTEDRRDASISQ